MKDLYGAEAPKTAKSGGKKTVAATSDPLAYRRLVKPLITEKATHLGSENKYVFMVAPDANKISIRRAVEAVYGVKPVKVNLLNVSGKAVTRGRISGRRKDWKKAIVTLKKGESIQVYAGV